MVRISTRDPGPDRTLSKEIWGRGRGAKLDPHCGGFLELLSRSSAKILRSISSKTTACSSIAGAASSDMFHFALF